MCVRHETDIPCRCCCCRCSAAEMTSTVCVYTREQRCCKAIRKRNKFSLVRASARAAQRSHAHIRDFKSMRSHARTIFSPCPEWPRLGPGKEHANTACRILVEVPPPGWQTVQSAAERWHIYGRRRGGAQFAQMRTIRNSQKRARTYATSLYIIRTTAPRERERERAEGGCGIFMRPFHPRCPAPGVCR